MLPALGSTTTTRMPREVPLQTSARLRLVCTTICALAALTLLVILVLPPVPAWTNPEISKLTVHLLLELFAITIATLIVSVSWHTFQAQDDAGAANVLIAGFTVVGVSDLVHALTYDGMPAFLSQASTPRAIFFWLMGRSFEVVTLALIALRLTPRSSRGTSLAAGVLLAGATVWFGSYHLDLFPTTFVKGQGVAPFKAHYEYVLCAANLAVAVLMWRKARQSQTERDYLLATSCFVMATGELAFTSYVAPSDFQNIFGHLYKVGAYALLYWSTFISSLRTPFEALRRSEARARESELRLLSISNNLPNIMVYQVVREHDGSMRFLHVSAAVERLHGLKPEDLLRDASLLYNQLHEDDRVKLQEARRRSILTMQVFEETMRLHHPDGSMRWMQWLSAPRRTDDGRVLWDGVELDITERMQDEAERRSLEAQLRESQKMESIGRLAGGIAHDFNTILASILGNLALMRDDLRQGATQAAGQALEQVNKATLRARNLVQQILTFSRRQGNQLVNQAPRPLLEESLALLRATLPARVRLDTTLQDFAEHVQADATQIQQVVLNLCTNAWQALQGSTGVIEVGLSRVDLDATTAREIGGLPPGPYVEISVRDNGCGMDAATRERIFEPFFTTKPVGQGTGLGLSVVHGIVRAHHGAITVDSALGQGSVFHVYLPAVAPATHHTADDAALAAPHAQGQHVLYVDDDEVMALMVERLLERAGFKVTCLRDAHQALAAVRAQPEAFDVVVTDFNMPEKSGLDLAHDLAALRPDLPVIISSGFISDELSAGAQRAGVRALLQKQNTLEDMIPALHQALAATAAA